MPVLLLRTIIDILEILKFGRLCIKATHMRQISARQDPLLKVFTSNFTSKMYIDTLNAYLIEIEDVYYIQIDGNVGGQFSDS